MSDPYFDNVTLLLHCDGTDGSTTFTDAKGHTVTPAGDAQIDTAQSKFGGASALFDGTGDRLTITDSADWDLPGDFTIECWVRFSTAGNSGVINYVGGSLELGFSVRKCAARIGSTIYYTAANKNDSNWHHIALVRASGSIQFFCDGVSEATVTSSTSFAPSGPVIGYSSGIFGDDPCSIDEIRFTKGVARYTTNFTVPTAAFPDTGTEPSGATTYTIEVGAGAAVSAIRTATVNAAAFLSYPAAAGTESLGAGAVLSRRYTPTATLSAAIQKRGLTKSPLAGAALKKTQTATPGGDSVIGRSMTLWAAANSAELGVQKFLSLAAGFLVSGRELVYPDALLQKTQERFASTNSYLSLAGLTRSLTVDAIFSSFRRVYMSSAVQGTATKTSNADSLVRGTLSKTLSAGFYITGLSSSLIVVAQVYLALAGKIQPGANAMLAKRRTKSPKAGAVIGALITTTLTAGAALAKRTIKTLSASSAVMGTRSATLAPSAAVQSALLRSLTAGAYLIPLTPAETLTAHDDAWTPAPRETTWTQTGRETTWTPNPRGTEWVPDN